MKEWIKWLFKIGWKQTSVRDRIVNYPNGSKGVEFYVTYTNIKTGEQRTSWIPDAP